MIRLQRVPAPRKTEVLLDRWTARVQAAGASSEAARAEWKKAKAPRRHVKALLDLMAHGAMRCMFCDDSLGTDIDHFQPLDCAPLRAFVWVNHVLACGWCNSGNKQGRYPLAADGTCLLIDPTAEEPADHLTLRLTSCLYEGRTDKGRKSIEVFGLNRSDLVEGRVRAFANACVWLEGWHKRHVDGDPSADNKARALLDSPFVDVVYAMTRLDPDIADVVIEQRTLPALAHWRSVYGTALAL
ncbi:HNH endonuclease [Streptomyces chartreusis]|uniref:HNH endonuclease n=1 Tax=Streptomyces chartreusis TaxID=1969 RepID=A0A7H8TLB8_STRCX|nr:HNH endonuclease [Streptomyces chartreusis]QKZ23812.1 HNH endonuclease [Streptomyces chartreusis]